MHIENIIQEMIYMFNEIYITRNAITDVLIERLIIEVNNTEYRMKSLENMLKLVDETHSRITKQEQKINNSIKKVFDIFEQLTDIKLYNKVLNISYYNKIKNFVNKLEVA
jgi:hypothetical protein